MKYIDNLTLRQNVQKALNRGEAYHQLHRAIFHENAGKFRVDTEKEQHIWNECSRLVGNAIIFYNTFLLSKLLEQIDITKKLEIIERIERVSPIAWQHVNLGGRFDLTGQKEPLEIDLLINQLNDFLLN